MEIIVNIHRGDDGRPVGTVRTAQQSRGRSFSGNLEFLAVIESLYQTDVTGVGDKSNTKGRDK